MLFQVLTGMMTMRNIISNLMLRSRDSEEPGLWGTSGLGCEECIVFTREHGTDKVLFSGKNCISLKNLSRLLNSPVMGNILSK